MSKCWGKDYFASATIKFEKKVTKARAYVLALVTLVWLGIIYLIDVVQNVRVDRKHAVNFPIKPNF